MDRDYEQVLDLIISLERARDSIIDDLHDVDCELRELKHQLDEMEDV